MFLEDSPLYVPRDKFKPTQVHDVKKTMILLPGEEKHFAPEDIMLIKRLMSALGVEESGYAITFVTSAIRLSDEALVPGTLIINMGVNWDYTGIHVALAHYQVRLVGKYFLLSSDLPAKLSKDSGLKKLLWDELMKVFNIME